MCPDMDCGFNLREIEVVSSAKREVNGMGKSSISRKNGTLSVNEWRDINIFVTKA
jgi:hypothetical protein